MKNKKKKLIAILLALVCLFVVVLGALADEPLEARTRNIITTGEVSIDLLEYADETCQTPYPEEPVTVMPGVSTTKVVMVKNTGTSEAWVRVKVDKTIELGQTIDGFTPDVSLIGLDINDALWTYSDGWYYYNRPLGAGVTTETPLFKTVSFDTSMQNEYQNSTAKVTVVAQAVQAAHNGETVAEAQGWPAEGGD